jgi:hypothetical protein
MLYQPCPAGDGVRNLRFDHKHFFGSQGHQDFGNQNPSFNGNNGQLLINPLILGKRSSFVLLFTGR